MTYVHLVWLALALYYAAIHLRRWAAQRTARNPRFPILLACGIWLVLITLLALGLYVNREPPENIAMLYVICLLPLFAARPARRKHLNPDQPVKYQPPTETANEKAERLQREAAERARKDFRNGMIAKCERLYLIHAPELKERFPRSDFDEFCRKHLGPEVSLATCEKRGSELIDIMQAHLARVEPHKPDRSLASLIQKFSGLKQQIADMDMPVDEREDYVSKIEAIEDESIKKAFDEGAI